MRSKCVLVVMMLGMLAAAFSASAGENPQARPFGGWLEGSAFLIPGDPDCTGANMFNALTVTDVEGNMLHLGRTVMHAEHCPTDTGSTLGGAATFWAANGDEIWLTYDAESLSDPPNVIMSVEMEIEGGTGRFTNASGSLVGEVYVTVDITTFGPYPIRFVLGGTITY